MVRPLPFTLLGQVRVAAVLVTIALLAASSTAIANTSYTVDNYQRFVSNGPWWTHAVTTNNTSNRVTWRVSYSVQRCSTWSGAVTMLRAASGSLGYNSCSSTSLSMSHTLAPRTSAAVIRRDVTHLNYYVIRRYSGTRLVDTGYATERDTFQDYAFSDHY